MGQEIYKNITLNLEIFKQCKLPAEIDRKSNIVLVTKNLLVLMEDNVSTND